METLMQDIRYGVRMLMRNPGFMIVAVITLALGIGANTAIFSMVDGILLRPLPVQDPAQITVLTFQQQKGNIQTQFSVADFRDIRSQSTEAFSDVFTYQFGLDGLSVDGKADRIMTNYVSGNFFPALGIKPELGRFILPSEGETVGADPVMVLSYSYWKTRFGGDRSIVGRKVSVDGHPITIVGVAPRGFVGISPLLSVQGFLPLGMLEIESAPDDFMTNRQLRNLPVLARLRPGTSLQQAQASLSVIGQRLSQQYPEADKDLSFQIYPELRARPNPDPVSYTHLVKFEDLTTEFSPESYIPYGQLQFGSITIVARSAKDPQGLAKPIASVVQSLDKDLPTYAPKTLEQYLNGTIAIPRFNTFLLAVFAALAMILTAVGLYGVISYTVAQRTHEIGIRMALGAQPGDMLRLVVGQGMRLALLGVGLGLVAAFGLTRFLSSLLFGVSSTDPVSFAVVVTMLVAVVLLACYIPARRAMRVDPMVALRYE